MLFILGYILEIVILKSKYKTQERRNIKVILLIVFIVATTYLFLKNDSRHILPVILIMPFRLMNLFRVLKGRMHTMYLRHMTLRTSVWLALFQAIAFAMLRSEAGWIWPLIPIAWLITAITMFTLLLLHLIKTRHIPNLNHFSDTELPTVSVCIPARNETDSLAECLRTIIANDYPKLEVLVLDDCSQDKTAEIIKAFAHEGVRFIQGDQVKKRWLSKNQAYDKLLREATGELILFCGVDVRLGNTAIRALTTTLINRKKAMISVLPLRFYSKFSAALVQPMRYWWELVPPRKLFKRPAVLSTCWLVNKKQLLKIGGFAAVSHAIIPEGYFARHFIKTDEYSFIRADEKLDVRTAKLFDDQWSTAVRTNYPQIRRRPEVAFVLTLFTLGVMIMPFIYLPISLISFNSYYVITTLISCIFLAATHILILRFSDPGNVILGIISLPLSALLETIIGYTSMLKYEFGSVEWKNRNICVPVMHVIPKDKFLSNDNKLESL